MKTAVVRPFLLLERMQNSKKRNSNDSLIPHSSLAHVDFPGTAGGLDLSNEGPGARPQDHGSLHSQPLLDLEPRAYRDARVDLSCLAGDHES